ncbi:hypothetical protein MN116_007920 [Schistosoma mekongi]|uniref:Uncharacterized protein n=1 Tax=Schistosoma mekongi TaxID=38744 RepID=A0AAE2D3B5_SCHME|nr:hypothetical protein MN116_007920 [Schistosoma mekongi]
MYLDLCPLQSPLVLLHQTCERLLDECAYRNRKPLKFRFIDANTVDSNYNFNHSNRINECINDIDQSNKFTPIIPNSVTTYPNEALDYSMKQTKNQTFPWNSSNTSLLKALSTPCNSTSLFPFSCFTSSTVKFSNPPSYSLDDILTLLQQGLINPTILTSHVNIQNQQSISSYSFPNCTPPTQILQQDNPPSENYADYLKLLSNFLNYLSLLKCFNTTDCSNVSINGTSDKDKSSV